MRSEKGFTLLEVMIALAILALIGGLIAMTTAQLVKLSASSNNRAIVTRQVGNVGLWISRDIEMAKFDENRETTVDVDNPGVFLYLKCDEWTDAGFVERTINYVFSGSELRRIVDGVSPGTLVAEHIDTGSTTITPLGGLRDYKYKIDVEASKAGVTVQRTYEMSQRLNPW